MEELYTIEETAKKLKVTNQTIRNWERDGKIKFTRVNGLPRITEGELKRIVKGE